MNSVSDAAAAVMRHHMHQPLPFPTSFTVDSAVAVAPVPQQSRSRAGLPPTPPTAGGSHAEVCMEETSRANAGLPPRKAHRRSRSDVAFGYLQPPPPPSFGGAAADDLFNAYLNMDGLDGLNSSDERRDDGDSRGSSMRANAIESSEDESEECGSAGIPLWGHGAVKRNAAGEPAPAVVRHARSLSMDSLMGNLSVGTACVANGGADAAPNRFSLEFGSGEFTPAEMKRIMADEKLAEMALADPKRVKRVLANRQSAARSKERKMRYIAELEQKVHILQTEATTLSAQLTLLQRDNSGLATQNNELNFRLQAMEQQAQLRDALNEALTAEVQRLKLAAGDLGDSCSSEKFAQQMQLNSQDQMFQLEQKQQSATIPFYHLQNGTATNHESKE